MSQNATLISLIHETISYICGMEHSNKLHQELDEIIQMAPPAELRQALMQVFFGYLSKSKDELPHNFEALSENIWFLYHFLEQAENIPQRQRAR